MIPRNTTFPRFLAVGGGIALAYAGCAAFATSNLPLPKALSAAILWCLCIPLGFWSHRRFTFEAAPRRHGLWLYAATQVLGIGIASGTSYLLATGAFWPDLGVHLLAAALAAGTSYVINRRVVFPESSSTERSCKKFPFPK